MGVQLTCLRTLRQARAMSQRGLAQRSGLSIATISKLETGKGTASIRIVHQLARALDLPPAEVLRDAMGQQAPSRVGSLGETPDRNPQ